VWESPRSVVTLLNNILGIVKLGLKHAAQLTVMITSYLLLHPFSWAWGLATEAGWVEEVESVISKGFKSPKVVIALALLSDM
jgi:hypothetical protein